MLLLKCLVFIVWDEVRIFFNKDFLPQVNIIHCGGLGSVKM